MNVSTSSTSSSPRLAAVIAVFAALAWGETVVNGWTILGVLLVVLGLVIGLRSHVDAHGDGHGPPEPRFFSHS